MKLHANANSFRKRLAFFLALGVAFCLIALLLHPASAHSVTAAAIVLLPVAMLGLVLVPRSLWPAADLDQNFAAPVPGHGALFQRPPPPSKN